MFSYKAENVQELGAIISVFAIIVLTTFSFHKLLMESRIKFLENQVAEVNGDKKTLEEENKTLKMAHNDLLHGMEIFSKDLNPKSIYIKNEKRRGRWKWIKKNWKSCEDS